MSGVNLREIHDNLTRLRFSSRAINDLSSLLQSHVCCFSLHAIVLQLLLALSWPTAYCCACFDQLVLAIASWFFCHLQPLYHSCLCLPLFVTLSFLWCSLYRVLYPLDLWKTFHITRKSCSTVYSPPPLPSTCLLTRSHVALYQVTLRQPLRALSLVFT